jgi:hypothetical protein
MDVITDREGLAWIHWITLNGARFRLQLENEIKIIKI